MDNLFKGLFDGTLSSVISVADFLACLGVALVLGLGMALCYMYRTRYTKSFVVTLALLPAVVCVVIMLVNGNVGTGVAVAGAFSLVRFRSVPGRARDIVVIFLSMTAGLACAGGYVAIALLFTLIVSLGLVIINLVPMSCDRVMDLNITIPESLRYANEFDDLFTKYLKSHRLVHVKTTNMGSLYKLRYRVELKDAKQSQTFIDELRCRNGNLEIALSEAIGSSDEL